jgi:hypothetical protein
VQADPTCCAMVSRRSACACAHSSASLASISCSRSASHLASDSAKARVLAAAVAWRALASAADCVWVVGWGGRPREGGEWKGKPASDA